MRWTACLLTGALTAGLGAQELKETILFYSDASGSPEIWMMNSDGSGRRQLTRNQKFNNFPVLSPDGTLIAYTSDDRLCLMSSDGSQSRQVLGLTTEQAAPQWSTDGRRIYFTELEKTGSTLSVVGVDGQGYRQVCTIPQAVHGFRLNPDGRRIVFSMEHPGRGPAVWTMNLDGTGRTRISRDGVWAAYPRWSPDGTRIVYAVADASGKGWNESNSAIHVMNADGSGDRALTRSHRIQEAPAWSPDGKRIVFQSNKAGTSKSYWLDFEFFAMDADGRNEQRLTRNPVFECFPSWGLRREPAAAGNLAIR